MLYTINASGVEKRERRRYGERGWERKRGREKESRECPENDILDKLTRQRETFAYTYKFNAEIVYDRYRKRMAKRDEFASTRCKPKQPKCNRELVDISSEILQVCKYYWHLRLYRPGVFVIYTYIFDSRRFRRKGDEIICLGKMMVSHVGFPSVE